MSETWATWVPLRNDYDVTKDDTAIDGSTSGYQLTDLTVRRGPDSTLGGVTELPTGQHTIQLGFYAEGDATTSFGCELWLANPGGPAQKICDITGGGGGDYADVTSADATTRLFLDDLTVADSSLWLDITTGNLLGNGMGWVCFTSRASQFIFPRFYNVGDTTEAKRIKALMRIY